MGLDACVYCDCVEKGLLKIPHPLPHLLFIDETGCPSTAPDDEAQDLHYEWTCKHPCPHQDFVLIHQWLGNISLVALIRQTLEKISKHPSTEFPIIWSKVIYSGSHCGDFLTHDDVCQLQKELSYLSHLKNLTDEDIKDLCGGRAIFGKFILMHEFKLKSKEALKAHYSALFDEFLAHLKELVQSSLAVDKPIFFASIYLLLLSNY